MITKDINIMICDGNMLRNEKLEFRFNTGSGVALLRSKEKVLHCDDDYVGVQC